MERRRPPAWEATFDARLAHPAIGAQGSNRPPDLYRGSIGR